MIFTTDQFPAVTVIIPTAGLTRFVTFEMSLQALQVSAGSQLYRPISSGLAAGVNDAIKESVTPFYWFEDDDHRFDPMIVLRLMAHDVPIVVPLTTTNKPPFIPVLFQSEAVAADSGALTFFEDDLDAATRKIKDLFERGYEVQAQQIIRNLIERGPASRPKIGYKTYSWQTLDQHAGLFEVGRCGRAGMLVKREVFEAIPAPWFQLGQAGNPEEPNEDVYFCRRAREAGYKILVDLELFNGHTAPCTVWPYRGPDGRFAIRLQWENDENVKLEFGARPPDPETVAGVDRPTLAVPPASDHVCREGWVCSEHPDRPHEHDNLDGTTCTAKATACVVDSCPFWGQGEASPALAAGAP